MVVNLVSRVVVCRAELLVTVRMRVTVIKGAVDGMFVLVNRLHVVLVIVGVV